MSNSKSLAWTGERMVPFHSDAATQMFHYQRYLYFQPWYRDAKVVDAASGEGYGTSFAGFYASDAKGLDVSGEAVEHANQKYGHASFEVSDVTRADYSGADLVVSFETIEHLDDPAAFLESLKSCTGRIVISTPNRRTHSPGNTLSDKPNNPFHTIEWTPGEFADLIRQHFHDRQVRFLSQEARWPGLIREGLDEDAMYCIAVIGDGELPQWPKIGVSIPTVDNPKQLTEAIVSASQFYPGELEFCVVCNGSSPETLSEVQKIQSELSHMVKVLPVEENLGYGRGSNLGLHTLLKDSDTELFAVSNDDVIFTMQCLIEMVQAYEALKENGHRPGLLGPVSNRIHGAQEVSFGEFADFQTFTDRVDQYYLERHDNVTEHAQIRGFFFLCDRELLETVGGFDPRFGLGNFEDDDLCLRAKLAGFSQWFVDGAVLFHHGSQTFQKIGFDSASYRAQIERNQEIFCWKWDLSDIAYWPTLTEAEDVELFVPLDSHWNAEFPINCNGEWMDLITQASDVEFAKWVFDRMKVRHRSLRSDLVQLIMAHAVDKDEVAA